MGATDAAIAAYERVLARDAADVAAYKYLGELLLTSGRIDAWLANFDRFEAHCPAALPLAVQALEVLQHRGDFAALDRYLEGLAQGRFRPRTELELVDNLEQLLYLLLSSTSSRPSSFVTRRSTIARRRTSTAGLSSGSGCAGPARIRVGYLSADLRNHVMGKMMWQALGRHDRSRFSLHFYSLSRERDEWTDRFAGMADSFVPLADAGEREAALRIAGDDLDLLVDLSTHTKGAKTRHPGDETGARSDHACRERWHRRLVEHRFQADGPPRRRRGKSGFPGRGAAADGPDACIR